MSTLLDKILRFLNDYVNPNPTIYITPSKPTRASHSLCFSHPGRVDLPGRPASSRAPRNMPLPRLPAIQYSDSGFPKLYAWRSCEGLNSEPLSSTSLESLSPDSFRAMQVDEYPIHKNLAYDLKNPQTLVVPGESCIPANPASRPAMRLRRIKGDKRGTSMDSYCHASGAQCQDYFSPTLPGVVLPYSPRVTPFLQEAYDLSPIIEDIDVLHISPPVSFDLSLKSLRGESPGHMLPSDVEVESRAGPSKTCDWGCNEMHLSLPDVPRLTITLPTPEVPMSPILNPHSPLTVSKYAAASASAIEAATCTQADNCTWMLSPIPVLPECTLCDPEGDARCSSCEQQWLACKLWYHSTDGGRARHLREPYTIPAASDATSRAMVASLGFPVGSPRGLGIDMKDQWQRTRAVGSLFSDTFAQQVPGGPRQTRRRIQPIFRTTMLARRTKVAWRKFKRLFDLLLKGN